jgi:sporulation protein YunB
MSIAKSESINLATLVINDAIDQQFKQAESKDLFRSIPNTEGSNNIQFDTENILRKQTEIVSLIHKNIKNVEQGNIAALESETDVHLQKDQTGKSNGVASSVPLGRVSNNTLLSNLGPEIPIEFSVIGAIRSDVKTKVVEFGINGGVIEVYIEVKVDIEVIIPLATDTITVTRNIPIGMGVFRGDVPQFFNGSGNSAPSIQLPKSE